ncbi:hypothetical protein T07_12145 [Trichinella nelsoni]|uniref:Uncharacterized protein n=1 Tax=Trichinella nelsoni TaxID=6336 RepID=A0A0V0SFT3_9BILA|nr:hypothetical protein T07_12145 [Trichinella nelsoni]
MWCIQANAISVISCKLRKFQKSLLCNTVAVVPCTSEKEHAILVQFETWKLIFVDKKGVIKIFTVKEYNGCGLISRTR